MDRVGRAHEAMQARLAKAAQAVVDVNPAQYAQQGRQISEALFQGMQSALSGKRINLADLVSKDLGIAAGTAEFDKIARAVSSSMGSMFTNTGGLSKHGQQISDLAARYQNLIALADTLSKKGARPLTAPDAAGQRQWAPQYRELAERAGVAAPQGARVGASAARAAVETSLSDLAPRLERAFARVAPATHTPAGGDPSRNIAAAGDRVAKAMDGIADRLNRVLATLSKTATEAGKVTERTQRVEQRRGDSTRREQIASKANESIAQEVADRLGISRHAIGQIMNRDRRNATAAMFGRAEYGPGIEGSHVLSAGAFSRRSGQADAALSIGPQTYTDRMYLAGVEEAQRRFERLDAPTTAARQGRQAAEDALVGQNPFNVPLRTISEGMNRFAQDEVQGFNQRVQTARAALARDVDRELGRRTHTAAYREARGLFQEARRSGLTPQQIPQRTSAPEATPYQQSVNRQFNQLREAALAPRASEQRLAERASRQQGMGGLQRWADDFRIGFRGRESETVAEQFGRTARFSVQYGIAYRALSAFSDALVRVGQDFLGLEDSIASLAVQVGSTSSDMSVQRLAASFGQTAVEYGFSSATGVQLGSQAIGYYGLADSSRELQQYQAGLATESAARIARISGVGDNAALATIQRQMVGLQRSFGIADSQVGRVENAAAFISKQSGAAIPDILAASADIGTLAAQAGFTYGETAALIARIQTTTGGTPQSAASGLRQVMTKADDPAIEALFRSVGIDTQGTTLADQLEQLASSGLSDSEMRRIVQRFGRGNSDAAASILLRDFEVIRRQGAAADSVSGDYAEKQAEQVLTTIGQHLQRLGTTIVEFGSQLAKSGILAPLGLLLELLLKLTQGATALVTEWNTLPNTFRNVLGGAVGLVAILNVLAMTMNVTAMTGAARMIASLSRLNIISSLVGASVARASVARASGGGLGAALGAAGAAAASGSRAGSRTGAARLAVDRTAATGAARTAAVRGAQLGAGAAAATSAAMSAMLPVLLPIVLTALAGWYVVDSIRKSAEETVGRSEALLETLSADPRTSRELGETSTAVAATVEEIRESARPQSLGDWLDPNKALTRATDDDWWYGRLVRRGIESSINVRSGFSYMREDPETRDRLYGDAVRRATGQVIGQAHADDQAQVFEGLEKGLQAQQIAVAEVERRDRLAGMQDPTRAIDFSSVAALNTSLQTLRDSGYSAAEQLDIMQRAARGSSEEMAKFAGGGAIDLNETIATDVSSAAWTALGSRITEINQAAAGEDVEGLGLSREQAQALMANLGRTDMQMLQRGLLSTREDEFARARAEFGDNLSREQLATVKSRISARDQLLLTSLGIEDIDGTLLGSLARGDTRGAYENPLKQFSAQFVQSQLEVGLTAARAAGSDAAILAGGDQLVGAQLAYDRFSAQRRDLEGVVAAADRWQQQNPGSDIANAMDAEEVEAARRWLANSLVQETQLRLELNAALRSRIQAETTLGASELTTDDVVGRGQVALNGLYRQLDLATSPEDQMGLQAQINDALQQQRRAEVEQAAAARLARVHPLDARGRMTAELANARDQLSLLTQGSSEYERTVESINAIQNNIAEYALRLASITRALRRDPRDVEGAAADALADAQEAVRHARAGGDERTIGEARLAERQARQALLDTHRSQRAALRTAGVAPGDELGGALVDLQNAQDAVAGALVGSEAYWRAIRELKDTQYRFAQTERQHASNLRMLGIDMTDPVAVAQEEYTAALAEMAAARSPWDRTNAELAVRRTEASAEQAAFQQRIGDLQMNERLGRISHTTYMSYLQAEHERLSSIANRTRQQQTMLDEVESLMQSAAESLSGQFNIGDIKLPTVYQVRRSIQSQAQALVGNYAGQLQAVNTTYAGTVNINGADFATVARYVQQAMGGTTGMSQSTLRRS